MIQFKDVAHLYLGCNLEVKCNDGNQNKLLYGKMVEITNGSNHGNWVMVLFEHAEDKFVGGESLGSNMHTFFITQDHVKPILRPLSDITEEEAIEMNLDIDDQFKVDCVVYGGTSVVSVIDIAMTVLQLTKKSFDLFGLIESGKALSTFQTNKD